MFCPNCGALLYSDQQFCPNCGKYITRSDSTSPAINPYSSVSVQAISEEINKNNWQGFLVFFSLGWLLIALDYFATIWYWNFGFDLDSRVVRLILVFLWGLSLFLARVVSKYGSNKLKMPVGYAIILFGLAIEFFSGSLYLSALSLLPIFTGIILLTSSVAKVGSIHPWIYPVGGFVGASITYLLGYIIYDRFGPNMVPPITFVVILVCMIVLIFLYKKENQTGQPYPVNQWLYMVGTIGGIFLLLTLVDIVFRIIYQIPIF